MLRGLILCPIVASLAACAVTDTYSPRASAYNVEAEALGNDTLLLNVERASHRLPLQFTDFQSLTGLTSSTGSIALSTPTGGFPSATPRILNPSIGGSLQTTFQGVVLNSQDFYQGVSAPISAVQARYFTRTIAPSELIFNFLFSQLVIYKGDSACERKSYTALCELSFGNNPRNGLRAALFKEMLNYLLRLGLSMEDVKVHNLEIQDDTKPRTDPAAPISRKEIRKDGDKRDVARYCFRPKDDLAYKLIADPTSICGDAGALKSLRDSPDESDQRPTVKMYSCLIDRMLDVIAEMDPDHTHEHAKPLAGDSCPPGSNRQGGQDRDTDRPDTGGTSHPVRANDVHDPTDERNHDVDFDDQPGYLMRSLNAFRNQNVRIEFRSRSTLGLFDYLGSMAHESEGPHHKLSQIRSVIEESLGMLPCEVHADNRCSPIFAISEKPNPGAISFDYEGQRLYLSSPDGNPGYSTQTLAIVKQILGLNKTSKNVPVPAIITGTLSP